jgi:hypothetical protein
MTQTCQKRTSRSKRHKEKVTRIADTVMRCSICEDGGWVCEIHPHNGDHTCTCGAGMPPCPWGNTYGDTSHAKRPKSEVEKTVGHN